MIQLKKPISFYLKIYAFLMLIIILVVLHQAEKYQKISKDILGDPYHERWIEILHVNDLQSEPTSVYRGNQQRQGFDEKATISTPVEVDWKTEDLNIGVHTASKSSPAVDASGVYVGTDAGWFYAFTHQGELKWRFRVSQTNQGIHGTAALDQDFAYFSAYNGRLYKVLKKTGELVWVRQLADAIGSSIFFENEFIYVSSETGASRNGYVAKLRRDTGEMVWRSPWLGEQIHSSPTLSSDRQLIYVGTNNGYLYALDVDEGQVRWAYDAKKPIKSTAVAFQNLVVFTSWSGFIYALEQKTGQLVWKLALKFRSQSSPTYVPALQRLVVSASSGEASEILGLEATTGKKIWQHSNKGRLIASALAVKDVKTKKWIAWTACGFTELCAFEAANGELLQKIDLEKSLTGVPVAWERSLYISVDEGPLIKMSHKK